MGVSPSNGLSIIEKSGFIDKALATFKYIKGNLVQIETLRAFDGKYNKQASVLIEVLQPLNLLSPKVLKSTALASLIS
jgi:hypothetical protein